MPINGPPKHPKPRYPLPTQGIPIDGLLTPNEVRDLYGLPPLPAYATAHYNSAGQLFMVMDEPAITYQKPTPEMLKRFHEAMRRTYRGPSNVTTYTLPEPIRWSRLIIASFAITLLAASIWTYLH